MGTTVLALLSINEDEPQALAAYLAATTPLLERVGARMISRFQIGEHVIGQGGPQFVVLVSYPNRAAVDSVFAAPEYLAVTPMRDRAFRQYEISIVDDLVTLDAAQAGG